MAPLTETRKSQSREHGNPATAAEIRQDYQSVEQQPRGRVASFYKQFTKLDLPEDAIDKLLDKRVDEFEAGLRGDFSDYDSYPDEAKLGLMDMVFNLGNTGLIHKFPTFTRAARTKDWRTCAQEYRRNGISAARNNMTKKLFEDAATAAGQ